MNVLAIDVGGTNIKILATGEPEPRKFPSGPEMTPEAMVTGIREIASDWKYDAVSIGYPGLVRRGKIVAEPHNLGTGWIAYDFSAAFNCPVKLINDAAMQALGSYQGGKMLFLGLGTGLGSALVMDGIVVPMELARLSYQKATLEDYVGQRGLLRMGKKRWRRHVFYSFAKLIEAMFPDDVVLGGGNVTKLKQLPPGCRAGDNANSFIGAFRLWDSTIDPSKGSDVISIDTPPSPAS
ncbi:MAG: ppgK [Planctomycetaceae bacterium]|nr:ppgK [Planctomycetaceae bacterium]